VEAGRVARSEELLGVGGATGAAHLLRDPDVDVEDAVVAHGVAVAPVARGVGGRGVEDVHGKVSDPLRCVGWQ
jgi:hypothetical protein